MSEQPTLANTHSGIRNTVPTTVLLPKPLRRRVEKMAKTELRTLSAQIVALVNLGLEQKKVA